MRTLIILFAFLLAMPASVQAQVVGHTDGVVRIAVLDTGAKIPDDYPNASVRYFDARPSLRAIEETGPGFRSEHGTWVTNAILEEYTGPVEILSYRVEKICREEILCEIDTASLGRAAMHAWLQGADIIQISSYGEIGPALEGILASIANKGIHIVMCAGNEGGASPLLSLARRNPQYIHIVGSLSRGDRRSFFSARDGRKDEPLLRWRLGEKVPSRSARGHLTHVTGTSYAASIMTADLARSISPAQTTLAAYDPVTQGPRPAPTELERMIARQEGNEALPAIPDESYTETRVALAEGGEIAVAGLNPIEMARLQSRAIRPSEDQTIIAEQARQSEPIAVTALTASEIGTRSRAVRPNR